MGEASKAEPVASQVDLVFMPFGLPLGRRDDNGNMIRNGCRVKVTKHFVVPITDVLGRCDYGSSEFDDTYEGCVYYDEERCEFRIDDQRFGNRKRSRNVYEFDSIAVIEEYSNEYTAFADAAPPRDGWYDVIWEPGDEPQRVWLMRIDDEPQDPPSQHEYDHWLFGLHEFDDPEAISLDIVEPQKIRWKSV